MKDRFGGVYETIVTVWILICLAGVIYGFTQIPVRR